MTYSTRLFYRKRGGNLDLLVCIIPNPITNYKIIILDSKN